jgi:hypothetical protein
MASVCCIQNAVNNSGEILKFAIESHRWIEKESEKAGIFAPARRRRKNRGRKKAPAA